MKWIKDLKKVVLALVQCWYEEIRDWIIFLSKTKNKGKAIDDNVSTKSSERNDISNGSNLFYYSSLAQIGKVEEMDKWIAHELCDSTCYIRSWINGDSHFVISKK